MLWNNISIVIHRFLPQPNYDFTLYLLVELWHSRDVFGKPKCIAPEGDLLFEYVWDVPDRLVEAQSTNYHTL